VQTVAENRKRTLFENRTDKAQCFRKQVTEIGYRGISRSKRGQFGRKGRKKSKKIFMALSIQSLLFCQGSLKLCELGLQT